jgi:membrane fusion protein, copper/silver efflux system
MHTAIATALLATMLALFAFAQEHDHGPSTERSPAGEDEPDILYWYDPMHPEHRFDQPGRSPFMDMDLVPRYAEEAVGHVSVASGIQQTMNIRTARAQRGALPRRIDTVGRVGYDQSRIHHLHPRVEAWIENVYLHAVGELVRVGDPLFTMYAPELVNAQEEFIFALERGGNGNVRSAREKLLSLAVQPETVAEIERERRVRQSLVWRARHDGIVSMLGIRHGMFVAPGDKLMELVDLSHVWVTADVFDRQAAWLEIGQRAEVKTSYGSEAAFETRVAYIYPELDPDTRTVRVRLPLENADGALKPGMWSTVRIFAPPLEDVVLIPREALIRTGYATRVVVRESETDFRVRNVVGGAESGESVEIREGIDPGEEVVVSGQFLLDSEAALRAGHGRLQGSGHQH